MKSRTEWYETFFDGMYSYVLAAQFDRQQSLDHARLVRKLLKLRKGQRVVDIPCGQGRLTIPLAETGLQMTGVDLTESFLKTARRKSQKERLRIRYVHSDMRNIEFDEEFHAAFNWFGSFGYFSDADNLVFCKKVFNALRPGGRFLVEGPNKTRIKNDFIERTEQNINGVSIKARNKWHRNKNRILSEWTFTRGGKRERHRVDVRVFDAAEIRSLLRAAGFHNIECYGRPPLGRFTRHSRRLMAVGRKPH